MAKRDLSPEKLPSGCNFFSLIFGNRVFWLRRSASSASTSSTSVPSPRAIPNHNVVKSPRTPSFRRKKDGSTNHQRTFSSASSVGSEAPLRPLDPPKHRATNSESKLVSLDPSKERKVPRGAIGISGELESMIAEQQKLRGNRGNLVRASSSNVMLLGNLGNLRQTPTNNLNPSTNYSNGGNGHYSTKANPKDQEHKRPDSDGVKGNAVMKPKGDEYQVKKKAPPNSFSRALSTRMDPETLKIMGNEDYKNGRFEEALALYDAAISIDPDKASYRSNKSAALTALGRLLEAVFECREAIQIDPHYHRAHSRLASLYLRLGEAEKAIYHYKQAGSDADPEDISKAKNLQTYLSRCTEARKLRDVHTLIRESGCAISVGADSAPQLYALQAEALLKLRRHQDADEAMAKSPNFDIDDCTKFFGPVGNASLLMVRAQVDIAAGRFEEAVEASQRASRLDPSNREVSMVLKRARLVAEARLRGNDLFRAARFDEACVAYGMGLQYDPYNSVLLCNRAACQVKLNHFDKAVEDCTVALGVRPSYSKARLRRADCYAKLEQWESSKRDYELLLMELPEDQEVKQALVEIQGHLNREDEGKE